MESFEVLLSRYAELIVSHGLNVQAGQLVNISCEVAHRELAHAVAQRAYERGAKFVQLDLLDPRMSRLRAQHCTLEQMKYVPSYVTPKYRELVDDVGANLKLVGPEDPDVLKGLDPAKINTARVANYQAVKYFYEQGIDKSQVQWTVAAAATRAWAKRVFPKLAPAEAEQALWQSIFKICRVDRADCLDAWKEHNRLLHQRAQRLTELGIQRLHFRGPGTDLSVGLSSRAVFKGGSDQSPRGVAFEPNLPTEECFTTPDWRLTSGSVTTTRPFFINGTLIKDLWLRFEGGEIVEFKATEGRETFKEYIASDPGGKRLGEVALVGIDSPVYQTGLVYEEILFDENAACHIAVGSAYKFCLKDSTTLSAQQLDEIGCNESSVHTDMMISSEQVDVIATLRDNSTHKIIERGRWCNL